MAKTATVVIEGAIYPDEWIWEGETAVSLARVRKQLEAAGEFDDIKLMINSEGGCCDEGWAIYDYLTVQGKPITSIVLGQCASMATILFLAGETRLISEHSTFMIHLPWGYAEGNQNDIRKYLTMIETESQKMLDFYASKTGYDEAVLAELMAEETYMNAAEAQLYGFATGLYTAPLALKPKAQVLRKPVAMVLAMGRKLQSKTNSNNMSDVKKSVLKTMALNGLAAINKLLNGGEIVAMDVTTTDGTQTLTIDTAGDTPAVGDAVTIDGSPAPDGTYTVTIDDVSQDITVAGGVITSIVETPTSQQQEDPAAAEGETVMISKEEYERLTSAVAAHDATIKTVQARLKSFEAIVGQMESADVPTVAVSALKGAAQARSTKPEAVDHVAEKAARKAKQAEAAK